MSDKYYYQEGAIHNDNKQVMNVTLSGKVDVSALIKGFFAKDAADAEVVETEKRTSPKKPKCWKTSFSAMPLICRK